MMKTLFSSLLLLNAALLWADKTNPSQAEIDEIVKKFAAKESEFATARQAYTYRQSAKLQEVGAQGGKWEEVSDIVFSGAGKREEKVIRAPVQTLRNIIMTPEDLQDMRNTQPFVLTSSEVDQYFVRFLGREKVDEIDAYVFAVKPKKLETGKRYFSGMIYVDDQDLQIVKSYGRGVGIAKNQQFPKFETFREQIDGKYWFPTYTVSNDTLNFDSGPVPIKMTVKYENYKRFQAESTIKFGDIAEPTTPAAPTAPPVTTTPGAPTPSSTDSDLPPHMRQKTTPKPGATPSSTTSTTAAPPPPPVSSGPELAPLYGKPTPKKKK
ncbi:MAG: hypothetical protein K2X03_18690 [Bryobacteraceae bacterium]|nr:hypothetical protein [Bryobacteraceae bacterium]